MRIIEIKYEVDSRIKQGGGSFLELNCLRFFKRARFERFFWAKIDVRPRARQGPGAGKDPGRGGDIKACGDNEYYCKGTEEWELS